MCSEIARTGRTVVTLNTVAAMVAAQGAHCAIMVVSRCTARETACLAHAFPCKEPFRPRPVDGPIRRGTTSLPVLTEFDVGLTTFAVDTGVLTAFAVPPRRDAAHNVLLKAHASNSR